MLDLTPFWDSLVGASGGGQMHDLVDFLIDPISRFAGVLLILYIGYKVMLYMSDIDSKLDPFVIIKPVLILGAITLYQPLVTLLIMVPMETVDWAVGDSIARLFGAPQSSQAALENWLRNSFETLYTDDMTYVYPGTPSIPGVYDIVAINPFLEIIHLLIIIAANTVGFYILVRQVILASMYYVMGVLAVPFSLIASNQSVLGSWFFGFISIMLWKPLLNVMKTIVILLDAETFGFSSALVAIALQVVMVLTILQIPKFANVLVSKGSELGSGIGDTITQRLTGGR
ncbi:MAG: hypothetical protein AAGB24_13960 [Bacteroidota bacterium]